MRFKVKENVPVMAADHHSFKAWCDEQIDRVPGKDWDFRDGFLRLQIRNTLYFYVYDPSMLRGWRFKKFVDLDICGRHPQRAQILDLVLREAQIGKAIG